MPVVTRARELFAAGWNCGEITRILGDETPEHEPSAETVRRWVSPTALASEQRVTARRNRTRTEARRLAKMREARHRGMSLKSIAIAASMFLGVELSPDQVKTRLEGKRGNLTKRAAGGPA